MSDPVKIDARGVTVEAPLVAAAFGLDPADVVRMIRDGRVTTRHEIGEGEDAGRQRVTFFHGGRAFRLTLDQDGRVLSRATFAAPARG